jgi:hypothetical protein
MKRVFAAAMVTIACIAVSTPSFARGGGGGHGFGRGIYLRNPTIRLGAGTPPVVAAPNRIPAPLGAPPRAPIINGPCSSGSCI